MGSRASRLRVLLIDDHDDTRDMYTRYLSTIGMEAAAAADAVTGVARAIAWQPQVIVMDWSMPRLTGDDATRILKADPRTRHIPVVILTAFGVDRGEDLEKTGAAEVCAKPCTPDKLAEIIRRL